MLKCVNGEIVEMSKQEIESFQKIMSIQDEENDSEKLKEIITILDILIGGEEK